VKINSKLSEKSCWQCHCLLCGGNNTDLFNRPT